MTALYTMELRVLTRRRWFRRRAYAFSVVQKLDVLGSSDMALYHSFIGFDSINHGPGFWTLLAQAIRPMADFTAQMRGLPQPA